MDSRRRGAAADSTAEISARFEQARQRMRSDLRLTVVTLFTASSFAIIGPFALYRVTTGEWAIVIADMLILATFAALTVLAWKFNQVMLAANLYATIASLSGLVTVLFLDINPVWILGLLVGNFLMAQTRVAGTVSAVVIACVALQPDTFLNLADYFAFLAVAIMVSLFSLIFATHVNYQHGQLTRLAERDGLTNAFNRRSLDADLELLARNAGAEDRSSLAIIDLDDFKYINDERGHDVGDRILVDLAKIVSSTTRDHDRFYRYGGDEFILLMPHTDRAGAEVALENLSRNVAERLECPGGRVRLSAGIAVRRPEETVDKWLGRADKALLRAKRSGKNRVEAG